ncbi:MAG: glycoside hydrolase family 5 protein [Clostridiales bacterium]|nr:glycoside hydrolase family 5 protein [Clostridiales bacterium]
MRFFLTCVLLLTLLWPTGLSAEEIPVYDFEPWRTPDNDAFRFVRRMKNGWNLGNALECYSDEGFHEEELALEAYWTGDYVTASSIEEIQHAGYSSVRIPVSWHDHMNASGTVSKEWMDRVQTVVDWVIDRDMIAILNVHHDIGDQWISPTQANRVRSVSWLTGVWRQIAERFAGYDERLVFEGMNEPRLMGTEFEWRFVPWEPACMEAAECINRLNQAFVETVRRAGGLNATRYLLIQSYAGSPLTASYDSFVMPQDSVGNRLLLAVHPYIPVGFAMRTDGTDHFDPSEESDTAEIRSALDALYDRYCLFGIPVVLDEYGCIDKYNLSSRVAYVAYMTAMATQRSMPCFLWDNSKFEGGEETYGVLDRVTLQFRWPEILQAQLRNGM